MSKVVRGIGRAVKKVVSGIGRAVKRVVKSPLGKISLTVAAAYFAAPLFGRALSAIGQGISSAASAGSGLIDSAMGAIGAGGAATAAETAAGAATAADVAAMADVGMGTATSALTGANAGGIISSIWKGMNTPAGTTLMRLAGGLLTQNETAMQINARDRWQREAIERANANQNVSAIRLPRVYAPPPPPAPQPMPASAPPPPAQSMQTAQAPLPGMPVQPVAPDPNVPQNRPWQQPGLIGGAMYA